MKNLIDKESLRNLTIFNEMAEAELMYGSEQGAAKESPLYFYNKFLVIGDKKPKPLTISEWAERQATYDLYNKQIHIKGRRRS